MCWKRRCPNTPERYNVSKIGYSESGFDKGSVKMTMIDLSASVRDALKQTATATSKSPVKSSEDRKGGASANPAPADPRAARDTVTLSDGANEIVNLNRAQELGNDLKNAPAGEDISKNLAQASKDVMRITTLFNETVQALFARWR